MLDHINISDTCVVTDKPVKPLSAHTDTHYKHNITVLGFSPSGSNLAICMYFDVAQSCSLSSN